MPFKKGQSKPSKSGRKKGTPNRSRILRVDEILLEVGINPVKRILNLVPHLAGEDQLKAWTTLLSYCQAKPKIPEGDSDPSAMTEEMIRELTDPELQKLAQSILSNGKSETKSTAASTGRDPKKEST